MIHILAPTKAYKAALSCSGLGRYGLTVVSNDNDEHPSFTSEDFLDSWLHEWKPYTEEEVYEEEVWHEWEGRCWDDRNSECAYSQREPVRTGR